MPIVNNTVLESYTTLSGPAKRLIKYLSDGKTFEQAGSELDLEPVHIGSMIREISVQLGLPQLASIYAIEQQLIEVHRQYGRWQEEKLLGAPKASLPVKLPLSASIEEGDEVMSEQDDETELSGTAGAAPEPANKQPDLDDLAQRIDRLKEKYQTTIAIVCRQGNRQKAAATLSVSYQTILNRLAKIYKNLRIEDFPHKEKKLLLEQGWGRYQAIKHRSMELRTPSVPASPAVSVSAVSKVLSSETPAAPPPAPILESVQDERILPREEPESPSPAEAVSAPAPAPQGSYGSGAVIALPPNLTNLDVLSGLFNGGEPSDEMARSFQKRKEKGLKPAWLVLSPSGVDPSVTLAQVVFFDRDAK